MAFYYSRGERPLRSQARRRWLLLCGFVVAGFSFPSAELLQQLHSPTRPRQAKLRRQAMQVPTETNLHAAGNAEQFALTHGLQKVIGDPVRCGGALCVKGHSLFLAAFRIAAELGGLNDRRVDVAGAKYGDVDRRVVQFGCQDLAEADDRVLGRAIRSHAWTREQARARRRIDYVTGGLLLQHARQKRVDPMHHAHYVDIKKTAPILDLAIDDLAGVRDARVVDQDVDASAIGKECVG